MEKISYLKKNWHLLLKSFKQLDITSLFIFLYDFIFFFIVSLSLLIFTRAIQSKFIAVSGLPMDKLMELAKPELDNILSQLQGFLFLLIGGFIALFLVMFISICILKGLVWLNVTGKKFSITYILKFMLVNLIWLLIWSVPLAIIVLLFKKELLGISIVLFILALMHFTNILYILFANEQKIGVIKRAFSIGAKYFFIILYIPIGLLFTKRDKLEFVIDTLKVWLTFLITYCILSVVFLVVSQVYWLFTFIQITSLNFVAYFMISSLPIIIYMIWSRKYLYLVVEDITKKLH